jgi:hypothetical protein
MIEPTALKTELEKPEYSGLTDAAILDALNAETVEYHVPVSSVDVSTHLMETESAVMPPLKMYNMLSLTWQNPVYPEAVRAVAEQMIDLATGVDRPLALHDNPGYAQALGVLVQAGRYTPEEVAGVINLGQRFTSVAAELGGTATQHDLDLVRRLPLQEAFAALRQQVADSYNRVVAAIDDGEANGVVPDFAALVTVFGEAE